MTEISKYSLCIMNAEHLFKCLASDDNKHALMCLI